MCGRLEFDAMKKSKGSQMLKETEGDCFGLRQVTSVRGAGQMLDGGREGDLDCFAGRISGRNRLTFR
jgi:hypothetical protein